jgi:hypothetical protein
MTTNYMNGKTRISYSATYQGTWERIDTHIPTGTHQHVLVAHKHDQSDIHPGNNYNSACSCCYLGICHTIELHYQEIAVFQEAVK